ncbi:uncharacterized protein LOC141655076 [Silene latifolia]|uniref:uncharacterized protein LOC141655076 n=1 Tax=Silene latifolia TaxID=37657 RepID=UPI003D774AA2
MLVSHFWTTANVGFPRLDHGKRWFSTFGPWWSVDNVLKLVSRAYLTSLPYLPDFMNTRIPDLVPNLPHITFLVWNVQGTGSKRKISAIKEVTRLFRPTVIALVETHMNNDHAVKLGDIIGYRGQSRVNAQGFSGGIWLYWNTDIVSVSTVTEHHQYITIEIARNGEVPLFFSTVYASPDPTNRRELWRELENFARTNNRPWLLAGDFNETRHLNERHGVDANMARRCENFINWIDNCDLIELAFTGASHTWARGNTTETRQSARLDRACHENVTEFVEENWPKEGIFPQKLSTLASKLKDWNHNIFGNIFRKKKKLMARIGGCQRELSLRRIPSLIKLEARLRRELDEVFEQEELLWYQKSRIDFIKDGDRNTSYFHISTLVRRWKNKINSLRNNEGNWTDDPEEIKSIIVQFYKTLFTEEQQEPVEDRLPWDLFQPFNKKDWDWLSRPYTMAEIESVVH